jgi:hypothetical protein
MVTNYRYISNSYRFPKLKKEMPGFIFDFRMLEIYSIGVPYFETVNINEDLLIKTF